MVHNSISRPDIKSIINMFKVRQLGVRSKYDNKRKELSQKIDEQAETLTKIKCKNN
jgi:hypothetical protein